MSRRRRMLSAGLLTAVLTVGCGVESPPAPVDPAAHVERVEEWRAWRHEQLAAPDGWLSLIGLHWLDPGEQSMGSDPRADVVVSREDAPARLGVFTVTDDQVEFTPAPAVEVSSAGAPFPGGVVWADEDDFQTPELTHESLTWFVIQRDDRLGVRVKDTDSPLLRTFEGMEYYPLAPEWRLDGTFEVHDPPEIIKVPSVLGTVGDVESPGTAVFTVDGVEYRLDLWKDSDDPANFFTAFADETNGEATYGGGRFLWIDAPDERGRIEVDFNRSYNPPCAFTPFSTCPLPPIQNRLPLRIEAGELAFDPPAE